MKKIFLILFLLGAGAAKTQNTYYKAYDVAMPLSKETVAMVKTLNGGMAILSIDSTVNLYKTDLYGAISWQRQFHISPKFNSPYRLTRDLADSSFYISTGISISGHTYLIKIDKSGNLVWSKTLPMNAVYIQSSVGGGFILTGSSNYDNYLLRFDRGGNIVWQNRYQTSPPNGGSVLPNVIQSKNNDYVIIGYCLNNGYDPHIYRVDSSGVLKSFAIYDLGPDNEFVNSAVESTDKSILVCGTSNSLVYPSFYFRIDSLGNILNFKKYDSPYDPMYSVILSAGPNRILMTGSDTYTVSRDLYTYMDYSGTAVWNKRFGNSFSGCGLTNSFNSFVLGGPGKFIAMIDSSGNGYCSSVPFLLKDTTYFIPILTPTIASGAINYSTTNNLTVISTPSAVLTTYCNFSVGWGSDANEKESLVIYPNPTSGIINISGIEEGIKIRVYNVLGELVLSFESQHETTELNLGELPNGIYFIRIGSSTRKVIKE